MAIFDSDFGQFLDAHVVPRVRSVTTAKGGKRMPHLADLVLLSCMDFRYPKRILDTMESRGLKGKYDHLILAGASFGVVHKKEWQTTFFDQLKFAVDKHGVSQVVILDHRDCGAYAEFLAVKPDKPMEEFDAHQCQCKAAMDLIVTEIPKLKGNVYGLLLPIEKVEELGTA